MEKIKPKHVIIIGAGPAGLAAAHQALLLGHKVTVIEKSDIPGGKGASRTCGAFTVDYGPHIFHGMTKEITDFMRKHGGEDFIPISIVQKLYVTEQSVNYPLQIKEAFPKFGLKLKARIFFDYLWVQIKALFIRPTLDSFKSWGVAHYGATLYNICFGDYSKRVWGIDSDGLSVEYAKRKLPSLNLGEILWQLITGHSKRKVNDKSYFNIRQYYYHRHGIGEIFTQMAQDIQAQGGEIIYNAQIKAIYLLHGQAASVELQGPNPRTIACDWLVSTAALDELASYLNPSDEPLKELAQALPFKHGLIVNVILKRPQLTEAHWTYLVNQRFYFNRLSEPKNFSSFLAPKDKTLIMLDTICGLDDQRWHWQAQQWKEYVMKDLSFFGLREEELEEIFMTKMEKAYPFYLIGYEKYKNALLDRLANIPNLITTGRYGLYMDINMHDAMVLGKSAVNYVAEAKTREFYQEHEHICLRHRD